MPPDPKEPHAKTPPGDSPPRSADVDKVQPGPPPRGGLTSGVDDIIAELRHELADISRHQLDLRRREDQFEQEYQRLEQAARRTAQAEVAQIQRRLANKASALNAQTAEITSRRARLDTFANDLRLRESRLKQRELDLERQADALRQRTAELASRFKERRQAMHQRIGLVRSFQEEIGRRLQLARDDLARQRAELQQRHLGAEQRAGQLEARERDLRQREAEIERRASERNAQITNAREQAEESAAAFASDRAAIEDERRRVQQLQAQVEQEREALADRQRELDHRWHGLREQRQQVMRQAEELEASRRSIQQERATTEQRAQRLERREQQLNERITAHEAERRRIKELEDELTRRQASAEEACRRAEEVERQAQEFYDESLTLREQTEARDGESRQAALAVEVERQELERRAQAIEAQQAELEGRSSQREQDLAEVQRVLTERAAQIQAAEKSLQASPTRWWLRAALVSLLAACGAAAGWLLLHPPAYVAAVPLAVETVHPDSAVTVRPDGWAARVLAEHGAGVLALDLALHEGATSAAAVAWRDALQAGRVRIVPEPAALRLSLHVMGADPNAAAALVRTAAEAYAQRANAAASTGELPPGYAGLAAWRDDVQGTIEQVEATRTAAVAELAALPTAEQRPVLIERADALEAESGEVGALLEQQRAAVAALLAAPTPEGEVAEADVAEALAADTIYQQDYEEFHATALQYRTELVVALLLVAEPLQKVQTVLEAAAASIAEQQELKPPASLAATLEAARSAIAEQHDRISDFIVQWRTWAAAVKDMQIAKDAVEPAVAKLVAQQNELATAINDVGEQATAFVDEHGARVERLATEGEGSTRQVVVGAVLRGDQAAIKTAVEELLAASQQVVLSANVELDTHDRKLRGLQMRLNERRALVHDRLKMDADRRAQRQHTERVEEARAELLRLERRRETLLGEMLTALGELRRLDALAQQRETIEARIARAEERLVELQSQRAALETQLANARRHGDRPDRVQVGAVTTEVVSGTTYRDAGVAAGLAFAATWLVALSLTARAPWQQSTRARLAGLLGDQPGE